MTERLKSDGVGYGNPTHGAATTGVGQVSIPAASAAAAREQGWGERRFYAFAVLEERLKSLLRLLLRTASGMETRPTTP